VVKSLLIGPANIQSDDLVADQVCIKGAFLQHFFKSVNNHDLLGLRQLEEPVRPNKFENHGWVSDQKVVGGVGLEDEAETGLLLLLRSLVG